RVLSWISWQKKSLAVTHHSNPVPSHTSNQLRQTRALVRHRLILPPPPHALMQHRLHRPYVLAPHGLVEALVLIVLAPRIIRVQAQQEVGFQARAAGLGFA